MTVELSGEDVLNVDLSPREMLVAVNELLHLGGGKGLGHLHNDLDHGNGSGRWSWGGAKAGHDGSSGGALGRHSC